MGNASGSNFGVFPLTLFNMKSTMNYLLFPLRVLDYTTVSISAALLILYIFWTYGKVFRHRHIQLDSTGPEKYKATVRSFKSFFTTLLPLEFQYQNAVQLFKQQLVLEHDLTVLSGKPTFVQNSNVPQPRHERWLQMLLKLMNCLVVNTVLFLLLYSKAKQCSDYDNAQDCYNLNYTSADSIFSLCSWNDSVFMCETATTNDQFLVIMLLVFIVAVAVSLLDKCLKFIISHAALAVSNRRMHWLYACCVRNEHTIEIKRAAAKISRVSSVRVAPAPAAPAATTVQSNNYNNNDNSTAASILSATMSSALKLTRKPGTTTTLAASASLLLAHPPVLLTDILAVEEREMSLEHYGDEWMAASVQSRKAT